MKILYAVCGEGFGHATRSLPIIEYLKKHHDVCVFAGGRALTFLRKHFKVGWIASMRLVFDDHSVNVPKTVLSNIARVPLYLFSFLRLIFVLSFRRPDVVITDFEPWSCWAALVAWVPIVSINLPGHYLPERFLLQHNFEDVGLKELCKKHLRDFVKLLIVTRSSIPWYNAGVLPSFFVVSTKDSRTKYVPPIVRKEIMHGKNIDTGHILVYDSGKSNKQLLDLLKKFSGQKFVVYGFNKECIHDNLLFRRTGENNFLEDLLSAKGVICTAGISLLTECVFLGKPTLALPIKGQCEQLINAYFLQKSGYGVFAEQVSFDNFKNFLKYCEHFSPKSLLWDPDKSLKKIEKIIYSVVKK